jgi:hypothetical protein
MPLSWTAKGLPTSPQKGFTENFIMNIVRSSMDAGPAKQRRRGLGVNTLSVQYLLDDTQLDLLRDFCLNDTQGVYYFEYPHPVTNQTVDARIVPQNGGQLFTINYAAPGYYNVSMTIEVMP